MRGFILVVALLLDPAAVMLVFGRDARLLIQIESTSEKAHKFGIDCVAQRTLILPAMTGGSHLESAIPPNGAEVYELIQRILDGGRAIGCTRECWR